MMKYITSVIALTFLALFFLAGCARSTSVETDSIQADLPMISSDNITDNQTNTDIMISPSGRSRILVDHEHVANGEAISFSGQATLPDGTYLQTQLFADGKPETWWPANKYVQVQNGEWEITVRLGENGAPSALLTDTEYLFQIWEKGNPSETDSFPFDLHPRP